jgi:hypothetical protein
MRTLARVSRGKVLKHCGESKLKMAQMQPTAHSAGGSRRPQDLRDEEFHGDSVRPRAAAGANTDIRNTDRPAATPRQGTEHELGLMRCEAFCAWPAEAPSGVGRCRNNLAG